MHQKSPEAGPANPEPIVLEYGEPMTSHFGGEVQAVMAHPKSPSTEPPVLFEGGFMVNNIPYIAQLAELGREAYTIRYFGRPPDRDVIAVEGDSANIIDIQEARAGLRKPGGPDMIVPRHRTKMAATKLVVMEELGIEQSDAIFQCANGVDGQLAANAAPDKFRNIVLVNAAGTAKQDYSRREGLRNAASYLALKVMRRVPRHESFKEYKARLAGDVASHTRSAQVQAMDATSAGVAYMADILTRLRQGERPPSVSMAVDLSDKMLDWKKLLDTLGPDDFDFMLVTDRAHGIGYSEKTMAGIVDLFPKMNALRANRQAAQDNDEVFTPPPLRERIVFSDVSDELQEEFYLMADRIESRDRDSTRKHGHFAVTKS